MKFEIPVTEDYQVGIFYNKNGDLAQTPNGEPNFTRWELLTKLDSELSAKTNYNNLTPQIMPESQQEGLLEVKGDDQSFRMIPMVQQHVNGCIEAGANFMILPNWEPISTKVPAHVSTEATPCSSLCFWDVRAEVGTNCQCRTWDNQAGTLLI